MIEKLITALSKKAGMSTEEIADTIWLALQIQESQSESVSSDFSLVKEEREASDNKRTSQNLPPQTLDSKETGKNQDSDEQKAKIYPQSQQQTESLDLSFKTPNAPSLRQPLTLARALKPLMRRIPAGTNFILDEAATIEHIANTGLWLPVLRPTLEPWLDLELVVDESISMQIWRQTIRDLEKLLKNYGIFRDVRVWGMTANDGEKIQVRRGIGAAAKNKFPRSSKELIDGSSRRLVLVVSDCVSSYWRDGTVTKALEIWANSVPTTIIQMLPKWLWKRTALGRASEVRLRALTPGVSNQNLIAEEVSLWDELEEETGVKIPVFTLETDKAATWAQMLSGKSSVSTLGFVFKLDAPVKENKLFNLDYSQLSAEDRVQAFRVTASPMARKLAGLLAAASVISLPVVRLIRGALLRESLQVNVAEVFLGGLLKPLSEIKVETHPDDVLYGFVDGVRELLIDSMPSEWVLQVVDKVSEYVAERVGLSLEDFAAVLRREKEVENSGVVEEVGYFATVTAEVLRRLGGEYVKVAEELEFGISSTIVLDDQEWEKIWLIWEKALSKGIGCRVSAGYGQVTDASSQVLYSCRLHGMGMAPTLLNGTGEFRPNIMFLATIRSHALRIFGGLTNADNAKYLVQQLFGGVDGDGAVGLLGMKFETTAIEMGEFGKGSYAVHTYDVEGKLSWLLTQNFPEAQSELLQKLIKGLTRFAMVFGGFGKSWRRADHRLFFPEYYDGEDNKPLIGCHWSWRGERSLRYDVRVRKLDKVGEFIEKEVLQVAMDWMELQGVTPTPDSCANWREAWHPERVQVLGRLATDAEDCEAVHWLHQPYRQRLGNHIREGSIYQSSVTGFVGRETQIGRLWHRMYPVVRLRKNPDNPKQPIIAKSLNYLELLTLFPDDSQEFKDFLHFLEFEQKMFQLLWGAGK